MTQKLFNRPAQLLHHDKVGNQAIVEEHGEEDEHRDGHAAVETALGQHIGQGKSKEQIEKGADDHPGRGDKVDVEYNGALAQQHLIGTEHRLPRVENKEPAGSILLTADQRCGDHRQEREQK